MSYKSALHRNAIQCAAFVLCVGLTFPVCAQEISPPVDSSAQPSVQIDLSPIGYRAQSRMDRLSENEPSVSLDFVDASHVLLTFNQKKMVQRLADCPPEHKDRLMHAAILELPGGKVVHAADWYLHDRRPYLWPLGPGQFLLRRLNDLYLVDSDLHEKLLLKSPDELVWVTVTPDARQIVIESADRNAVAANTKGPSAPRFIAKFLDAQTLVPQRRLVLNELTDLTASSTGYTDLVHKGEIWMLRFGPGPKQRHNLARVKTQTVPDVLYSSNNSLLVGRCPAPSCDYSVTAFTLNGRRLWQQHWPRYRFFPTIAGDSDSSRFAVGSLQLAVNPAVTSGVQADQEDAMQPELSQLDVFQQNLQVFETASGTPLLSLAVSPAMMSGRNYSLSPDGSRLAVLQNSALQVFELPLSSATEQAQFNTLKSDLPELYSVAPEPDSVPPPSVSTSGTVSATASSPTIVNAAQSLAPPPTPRSSSSATPAETSPLTTIRVSTKTVLVDVVVTDAKGHPLKGLTQHDFQVQEDGQAQDLRSFREFDDGILKDDAASTTATQEAPKLAKFSPNVFNNQSHVPASGAVTLVLFDMLNTPTQDQSYARQQLVKFLQSKPKNMQFALCTMSLGPTHLRLIQGFTDDETLLLAAAKGGKNSPKETRWQVASSGTENNVGTVSDLAKQSATSGFQGLLSALQQTQAVEQVVDTEERSAITLDSMMLLARYLSGIRGRKNIVWLSGSFPISLAATTSSNNLALDNPNYTEKIKRVTNLMAEAQIAIYPVDVRGLLGAGLSASNSGGLGGPGSIDSQDFSAGSVISPAQAIPSGMQGLAQEAAERDTLLQFATATGGKAFFNTNGIRDAVAIAAEQGSNYYTLSYNPTNKNFDGKFRKIKVQLATKGYSLHYRQGYYADDVHNSARDAEIARRARSAAMQHGSPLSRQLLFSVKVVPVGSKIKMDPAKIGEVLVASTKKTTLPAQVEVQHYSIDYSIDGSELRFTPLENRNFRNTLTLMVTSFNREGGMLTGVSNAGTRELQPAEYEKAIAGQFGVQEEIDLPLQASSVRVGLQDQMSNRIGTVDIPLPVPPDPEAQREIKNPLPEIEPD